MQEEKSGMKEADLMWASFWKTTIRKAKHKAQRKNVLCFLGMKWTCNWIMAIEMAKAVRKILTGMLLRPRGDSRNVIQ